MVMGGGGQSFCERGGLVISEGRRAKSRSSQDPFLPGDPFGLQSLVLWGREAESGVAVC